MKHKLLTLGLLLGLFCVQQASAQTTLYTEDFTSGALPAGWANDSLGFPATHVWIFNNQYNRTITGAGFDANFAIFDSDEGSSNDGFDENASLTTAPISIAGTTGILSLEFDEQYRALAGPNSQGSARRVELSADGGLTWNTIIYDSVNVGYPNPATHTAINISSVLGASAVQIRFTFTGSYDWWWAIDNLTLKSFAGCTSAPLAGTTTTSSNLVCSGNNFTLSLAGADSGIVISYKWQSSSDSLNWNNIAGAILPTLTTNISATTYFRCVLTCSGFSSNSVAVGINLKSSLLCYCNTNLGGATCPSSDYINNVTIVGTTLNNSDTICNSINGSTLSVFAPVGSATATLTRGNSYTLSVTTTSSNIISVWIDYDQNGIYSANEWQQVSTTSTPGVANTVQLNIPFGIPGGQTGMRIRSRAINNQNDSVSACINFGSGEAEDYVVTIDIGTGVSSVNPNNNFSVVPNPATNNLSISFMNNKTENSSLKMFNLNGQVVFSENLYQFVGSYAKTIDVSEFPKGIYNLQLISSGGLINKKVVIE